MDIISRLHTAEKRKKKHRKIKITTGNNDIKHNQFCGLSREKRWQDWLKNKAPDLHENLLEHLRTGRGCKGNRNKMLEIRTELDNRGFNGDLLEFLRDNYPHMVN